MLDFGYFNMDCMQGMKEFPDKYFDLAIVDPPYGINIQKSGRLGRYNNQNVWDDKIPNDDYFNELFRVSKNQIIWGGNYFPLKPTKCFLTLQEKYGCEFAFTTKKNSGSEILRLLGVAETV